MGLFYVAIHTIFYIMATYVTIYLYLQHWRGGGKLGCLHHYIFKFTDSVKMTHDYCIHNLSKKGGHRG